MVMWATYHLPQYLCELTCDIQIPGPKPNPTKCQVGGEFLDPEFPPGSQMVIVLQ